MNVLNLAENYRESTLTIPYRGGVNRHDESLPTRAEIEDADDVKVEVGGVKWIVEDIEFNEVEGLVYCHAYTYEG